MKNRNLNHKDDWATPPHFLEEIKKEFGDFFDPCPWHHDMSWNGLMIDWQEINFVNPPYSQKLKEAFVIRAIEHRISLNYKSILLLPVSTSTILFHKYINRYKQQIRFLKGRLRFIGINDKGQHVNYDQIQTVTKETIEYYDPKKGLIEIPKYIKNSGQHDSMLVIF